MGIKSEKMKKKMFLLHHLGLGDHILCNALYRHYAKQYEKVVLPVYKRNEQTMKDMLSDLKNISFISFPYPGGEEIGLAREAEKRGYEVVKIGGYARGFLKDKTARFDEAFYKQANLDFEKRWTEFYYPCDHEAEYGLFKKLCGARNEGKYIFLHEDASRGLVINRQLISDKYKIVSPVPHNFNSANAKNHHPFLHYGYILKHAAEIHCIESSFAALVEGMMLKNKKYAHRYARPEVSQDYCHEFTYKTAWEVII